MGTFNFLSSGVRETKHPSLFDKTPMAVLLRSGRKSLSQEQKKELQSTRA